MTRINKKRLLGAGLLAGLVINVLHAVAELVMAAELERTLAMLGLEHPPESAMLGLAAAGFLLGILVVWLYAALRPRYGAGPATALRAAAAAWLLACALPNLSMAAFGMITPGLFWSSTIADLVTITAAALAGARVYREPGAGATVDVRVPAFG